MKDAILDLVVVASVASIGYGCWMVYPPLAFIVTGTITFTLSLGILGNK